jgi:hypothetical protein
MLLLIDQSSQVANVPKSRQTTLVMNSGRIEVGPRIIVSVVLCLKSSLPLVSYSPCMYSISLYIFKHLMNV